MPMLDGWLEGEDVSAGCVAAIQYFEQAVAARPDSGQRAPVVEKPCAATSRKDVTTTASGFIARLPWSGSACNAALAGGTPDAPGQHTRVPSCLALVLL